MSQSIAVFAAADRADSLGGAGRRAAVAILGFRMAGVTLTDSGVGLFIAVLRPSAPVVVQRIAGEEGRLIRRALGAQTADCTGLVVDCLFRAGGGGFQVLCIHGLHREVVGQLFAILSLAKLTDGILGAGRFAAGVLRVAFLSRVIRHIAVFIVTFIPVMRCIGRPIGLPAMARSWNRLYFCCVALGAAICLFARFCAGRRCCYRTVVPSMRAYVILYIATGTLLPVLVIIMCPTGSKIMSQNIAIFRTANCAFCFFGAGRFAAGVFRLMKHRAAGADLPVFRFVGFPVVALMVMGVALSIEHGQGLAHCIQILAFVCPRVSIVVAFASLEQRQHRVVGEVCGGFGLCFCNVAITIVLANCVQVRTGKIVAVFYSAIITANDFANSITIIECFNRSNIVAIGDRAHVKPRNTASFMNSAGNCANIIAVDDSRIVNITASNTANIIATAASNAAIVAAIFNRCSIQSAAHNATDVTV